MPKLELAAKVAVKPRVTRLITERIEKKAQLAVLEAEIKELDAAIMPDCEKAGGVLETDDFKATKVESQSANIKRELLLELGVKPSIIKKATDVKPYSYLKITVKKQA